MEEIEQKETKEILTSRQNPVFRHVRKLIAQRKYRHSQRQFVAEGPKLLQEAIQWGAKIELTIAAPGVAIPAAGKRQIETSLEILHSLADTETPQGILFVCTQPDTSLPAHVEPGRYLILDGIQDPGNLGTIWRTADAFGAKGLFLTGSCADPFSPKTIRATMGACFRLPVWKGKADEIQDCLQKAGLSLCAAALHEDAWDVRKVDFSKTAVVIGSEGHGVSQDLLDRCPQKLTIPMRETCESLNAAIAASVVLWEGWRQSSGNRAS